MLVTVITKRSDKTANGIVLPARNRSKIERFEHNSGMTEEASCGSVSATDR
jgi:hypothetical protein